MAPKIVYLSPRHTRPWLAMKYADALAAGGRQVQAITWPGNRGSVDFHKRLGFRPDDGPGTTPIYGVPAYPNFDGDGQDRAVLIRALDGG